MISITYQGVMFGNDYKHKLMAFNLELCSYEYGLGCDFRNIFSQSFMKRKAAIMI